MTILLDNGHGVNTPGKRSPDGVFREYRFNRDVTRRVLNLLRAEDIAARLLVPEEYDVSLSERVKRANVLHRNTPGGVILLSVHANAAGDGSKWTQATGWSAYTSRGQTESDRIAEALYDAFTRAFPDKRMRVDMLDGDRDIEADFYILRHTACPAVLTENFFYDNRDECRWLGHDSTVQRIAEATAAGLAEYVRKLEGRR